jgi:hypothetical protein
MHKYALDAEKLHRKLESGKLNVQRAWHVIEETRTILLNSGDMFKANEHEFDRMESLMCAAVTLLRETHLLMTKGDDVANTPPSVL